MLTQNKRDKGDVMERISWDDKYSIGNEEIDRQHMQLFEMMNQCISEKSDSPLKYLALAREMLAYCQIHFKTEEEFMYEINYPFVKEHVLEHKSITAAVEKLTVHLYNKNEVESDAIDKFVFSWVAQHVIQKDGDFRNYPKSVADFRK
ncbi:hypothetical protein D0S45_08860 [Marinifilum sp. JC120]|nr:hypothetical protein D0S45_08860 [Marinifilum sp. JC120]